MPEKAHFKVVFPSDEMQLGKDHKWNTFRIKQSGLPSHAMEATPKDEKTNRLLYLS